MNEEAVKTETNKMVPQGNLYVYRSEMKFFLSQGEYRYLQGLLSSTLKRDTHAGEQKDYFIRSLYFDSFDNRDYYEKLAGVFRRKKIRIRIYDPMQDWAKLEIKNKFEEFQDKNNKTL